MAFLYAEQETDTLNRRLRGGRRQSKRAKLDRVQVDPVEVKVLATLMKDGGNRVEYIHVGAAGTPTAVGFYVCGEPWEQAAPADNVKQRLYTGLYRVEQELGSQNLVAIYVDVGRRALEQRPAYRQLVSDLRAGMFRRVFVLALRDLAERPEEWARLQHLLKELDGLEIIRYDTHACRLVALSAAHLAQGRGVEDERQKEEA